MRLRINDIAFYMRNVRTRMPFKYGAATLTSVPILHVVVQIELEGGQQVLGVAGDILPPKWFDKDPTKDYQDNVGDLVFAARAAARAYSEAARMPGTVFDIWQQGYAQTLAAGDERGLNHLTAAHGSTLMERALIDAVGIGTGQSYHQLLWDNTLGIDLGQLHSQLQGVSPRQAIEPTPLGQIHVRHTVGLADPIWASELSAAERLDDGLPQALEEYIQVQGISYFKIKVNGDLEADLARVGSIAALLDRSEAPYFVSLDGNEQYQDMDSFLLLLERMEADPALGRFNRAVLYIEQPLERSIALDEGLAAGIKAVSSRKPMLVDESDGDIDTFARAVELGYLGVSSKNCKGLIKAVANQALARYLSTERGGHYFLTGEDLMNLPVVPLQQDLSHLAALGIGHAERNGHHYVRGLDHLSAAERRGCAQAHQPLYGPLGEGLTLAIDRGRIDISSLQVPGLGVGVPVDVEAMIPLDRWNFESLA